MPGWLSSLLKKKGEVSSEGVLPVLRQLLEQCSSTEYAYLCHPYVAHVSKIRGEGGFCGYRNIQMLVSYIVSTRATGSERFGDRFPTVFEIQDLIENAWDMGINSHGRQETGGIKGTRKYIGTPEAQALFCSLSIPCAVQAVRDEDSKQAGTRMLDVVENYFRQGVHNGTAKLRLTALPPIYFQRRGHSMTIIGLEKLTNGQAQLLVFDPTFRDSPSIQELIDKDFQYKASTVDRMLRPYRRSLRDLRHYREFELL
ncbi:hypothetical protein S40285_05162 [Stachybotrys chlorohalonatus IBT 40285]|uniref:UFSP1/2/DUB catalytic domain-containing protein n=1 Tax=Stachybotrys chlorohalonatus (strain IBT 40285) TaxID=1283841 RepID=A0A084QF79_STAC4|nr:hypothetical protein S40285_05162 [Stachybotrys chlorohalonata IBT 40285]